MTYVHEYVVGNDNVKVEYCFSAVSESIKVVDMWVNGKFHRVNWMSHEGRDKLMDRLEADMEDRMCGTIDDMTVGGDSYMDNLMTTGFGEVSEQDEGFETEVDLDRDMPEFQIGIS
tara:strand:- start:97 stop:444 length:348 start_codon:yes stop_codon:yes gene_type:complete